MYTEIVRKLKLMYHKYLAFEVDTPLHVYVKKRTKHCNGTSIIAYIVKMTIYIECAHVKFNCK